MAKIIAIADTQLYKKLYNLNATRQDWYDALISAANQTVAISKTHEIDGIIIPGDLMDTLEVGPSAVYYLHQFISILATLNKPIAVILGNHDKDPNDTYNWITVCKSYSNLVYELSLETPVNIGGTNFYGSTHMGKLDAIKAVQGMTPSTKEHNLQDGNYEKRESTVTKSWLCLHQSLKELSSHESAWEVSVDHIPGWIHGVLLGDFHNSAHVIDQYGRWFIYPGSIETESFGHETCPGFIYLDTDTPTYSHHSTQQRLYLTFDLTKVPSQEWVNHLQAIPNPYPKQPVIRVYFPQEMYDYWLSIKELIKGNFLRIDEIGVRNATPNEETKSQVTIGTNLNTTTKEVSLQIAMDILKTSEDQASKDTLAYIMQGIDYVKCLGQETT